MVIIKVMLTITEMVIMVATFVTIAMEIKKVTLTKEMVITRMMLMITVMVIRGIMLMNIEMAITRVMVTTEMMIERVLLITIAMVKISVVLMITTTVMMEMKRMVKGNGDGSLEAPHHLPHTCETAIKAAPDVLYQSGSV